MAAEEAETLESLLTRATNPLSREADWEHIIGFCDQVNKELEGPQIAVRLLAHKIQSPQEKEALYALQTLEACVKNCGRRFHQEVGKFRFLNEMIKVVSPKYLGNHTTEKVKGRCVELLYSWSVGLQHECKVKEAYDMLKHQGIVKADPVHIDKTLEPPPPPIRDTLFQDEEKSKLLARLLKSKHPEDLQAANRLIKNMVKQDAESTDRRSKRQNKLETVNNNAKVLSEMLAHYKLESATETELDLMKELYDTLEKERPSLFRLASDTDEKDQEAINDILATNDSVVTVMNEYKQLLMKENPTNGLLDMTDQAGSGTLSLLDIQFDKPAPTHTPTPTPFPFPGPPSASFQPPPSLPANNTQGSSLLDDDLKLLGACGQKVEVDGAGKSNLEELGDLFGSMNAGTAATNQTADADVLLSLSGTQMAPAGLGGIQLGQSGLGGSQLAQSGLGGIQLAQTGLGGSQLAQSGLGGTGLVGPTQQPSTFPALSMPTPMVPLSQSISQPLSQPRGVGPGHQSPMTSAFSTPLPAGTPSILTGMVGLASSASNTATPVKTGTPTSRQVGLDQLDALGKSMLQQSLASKVSASAISTPTASNTGSPVRSATGSVAIESLAGLHVPLATIQPGSHPSLTAYDKNNLKIVIHIGRDRPRPDVHVMVVSVMSTNTKAVKTLTFLAAVPKTMKVKLQTASATDLPAYNPILPPAAITQVMLIANPQNEKIRLKFKLSYSIDSSSISDVGDVDDFPVP